MVIRETRPWAGSTGTGHGLGHCSIRAGRHKLRPDSTADQWRAEGRVSVDSEKAGGLVVAVEKIVAARGRATQPSDGGGSGRTDLNDG